LEHTEGKDTSSLSWHPQAKGGIEMRQPQFNGQRWDRGCLEILGVSWWEGIPMQAGKRGCEEYYIMYICITGKNLKVGHFKCWQRCGTIECHFLLATERPMTKAKIGETCPCIPKILP
jgi:hypothetical protein